MDRELNVYDSIRHLQENKTATAVALDLIGKACSSSSSTGKVTLLKWVSQGDNLTKLRDKIKESASES